LLKYGARYLALHLLKDRVDGLRNLVLEHLPEIQLGLGTTTIPRPLGLVPLVLPARPILALLLTLAGTLGVLAALCLCLGVALVPISFGG